ncbi:hypothetical protein PAGU2638_28350 [Lysobacter sp. PAGU 2638]
MFRGTRDALSRHVVPARKAYSAVKSILTSLAHLHDAELKYVWPVAVGFGEIFGVRWIAVKTSRECEEKQGDENL